MLGCHTSPHYDWDACTAVATVIAVYYIGYFLLLCILDCDLNLAFLQFFGKSLDSLSGKVVWITGASSGIGEAMAYEVARNGGRLILSARREEELHRVKSLCLNLNNYLTPKDILIIQMDSIETDTHEGYFNYALREFGQIDILINNAGRSQRATWEDINLVVDRQLFDVNVFGVLSLSRIAVDYFLRRGKGRIAVMSSLVGFLPAPFSASYTASKHALHGYFGSLRMEKSRNKFSATVLCPGPVYTNFLQESFTERPGMKYRVKVHPSDRRMKVERCAKLCLIAVLNRVDEAWIALFPFMLICYTYCYFPNLFKLIMKFVGRKTWQRLRDSRATINP